MPVETRFEHITSNEDRIPRIASTTMKVVELVGERRACRWSCEELHFQHHYLTVGQIDSALGYYRDYRDEFGGDIQRQLEQVEGWR
jgi:uncharacterized protein (DUF433 family)